LESEETHFYPSVPESDGANELPALQANADPDITDRSKYSLSAVSGHLCFIWPHYFDPSITVSTKSRKEEI
jgi:hypothetical protein